MTKRYCFLGNSHIAAVKQGWDDTADRYPGIEATMFAAGGKNFADIKIENGVIEPQTDELRDRLKNRSDGQERIVLADYDRFVVIGLGFDSVLISRIYKAYHTILHRKERPGQVPFVSVDVLAQMLLADLKDSLSYRLATAVRAHTGQRIHVCWVPLKRRAMLSIEKSAVAAEAFAEINARGESELLQRVMERVGVFLAREGLDLITQPEETIDGGIFTIEEYSKAASLPKHTPNQNALLDIGHMNRRYGALMVGKVIDTLSRS